ncbi:hypothetical protein IFM89_006882 [Coptis chinensis]|uniref:Uncharacterized protein n=1 Tax=Coptis chinensis TaxID=261450 RepID=A0A835GY03_9MAGN|nr:hypothetical protein IFM89_006882 [Coptis chinensis]
MVSFGPLHYGKEELRDMEAHKRQYLKDFLARSPRIKLEDCIGVLKDLEDKALDCYAQTISLNSNDFIKLMLLDACFIIELFLKWRKRNSLGNSIDELIYNKFRMKYWMRFDLLLLENQLPFFVIEKLYDLYLSNSSDGDNVSLLVLTIEYFS